MKVATCKLPNTLTLLKAALELILMVIDVARFPDLAEISMRQVEQLSLWIKNTHGFEPSESKIEKEVQVKESIQ